MKVAILVPTSGQCRTHFAASLAGLMRNTSRDIELRLMMCEGSVIHMGRESLAKRALAWDADYMLWLDDDMVFPPEVLPMLLDRRLDYVACNYPRRHWPVTSTALGLDGKLIDTKEESTGLVPASFTGFGVALTSREVFHRTPRPWFLPNFRQDRDAYETEDKCFCDRVRAAGIDIWVDQDVSKLLHHTGIHLYSWKDAA